MATTGKRTIRLISVANSFWMTGRGLGGGDRRAIEILKRFLRSMKVTCMISKMGYNNYSSYISLDYIVIPSVDKLGVLFSYFGRSVVGCFRIVREKGDIVYPTSDFLPDVLPAYVLKLKNSNTKWVQIVHHLYENPFKRVGGSFLVNLFGFLSQHLSFVLMKTRADLIIVVNPVVKQQLSKIGFDSSKIFVSYNGVDLQKIHNLQPSTKTYDCVFLGRLHATKGVFDLVEIWKNVTTKNPYATLAIIGGGDKPVEQKLGKIISENKLERNVDVLGYLKDEKAFSILKSSKIFIFPSYEEGFGIAILEAMACGLPAIAWNLPVYREVFPQGMITVPIGNIEEFAEDILKLLEDSESRNSISNDALRIASKYSWNDIARQEMLLIEGL